MMTAPPPLKFGDVLAFHDSGFVSWRIRSRTNGWANHVAFVADPAVLWHSTFGKGLHSTGTGPLLERNLVILRPQTSLGLDWSFTQEQKDAAWAMFLAEQGSGYDTSAILGFLFLSYRNRWQNPDGWFCSEWVTAVLLACGVPLFNVCADMASVSPTDVGVAGRLKPIWYRLPEKVAKTMPLTGVPNG